MADIDIGPDAIDRATIIDSLWTYVCLDNPANASGTITKVELWFFTSGVGVKVGTFYGTPPDFTLRDSATIGNVASGSKQTFPGLSIDVQVGDYIGCYFSGGYIETDSAGYAGVYYKHFDQFSPGQKTYTLIANYALSLYGEGEIEAPPAAKSYGLVV